MIIVVTMKPPKPVHCYSCLPPDKAHGVSLDNVASYSKVMCRVIVLLKTAFLPGLDAFEKWTDWSSETVIVDTKSSEIRDLVCVHSCFAFAVEKVGVNVRPINKDFPVNIMY